MKLAPVLLILILIQSQSWAQSHSEKRVRNSSVADQVDSVFESMAGGNIPDSDSSSIEIILNPLVETNHDAEELPALPPASAAPAAEVQRGPASVEAEAVPASEEDFCFQKFFLLAIQNPELYERSINEGLDLTPVDPSFAKCSGYRP